MTASPLLYVKLIVLFVVFRMVTSASWFDPDRWRYGKKTCKCSCGVSRKDEQRIVGGRPTEAYDYPWMAGLLYKGALYCGATLINDRYVVTAAHCVDGLDIDSIHVLLGGHDLENVKEEELELRSVVRMVKHPKFEAKTFNHDIAVLQFDDPIPFSRSIGPVCLPQSDIEYAGKVAVVTGWGRVNETGNISPILAQVAVPIYTNADCQKTKYGAQAITENMMCAGYDHGELDACQGDSGGPLHLEGKDRKIDLIGVVSWGQGCGREGYPGVYTRMGRYLKWIAENTVDACYCGRRQGRNGD
ncbi:trypsin-7-like [Daphnia carinata]|uniref:trypsin-7-like n=1 Tax=Daphnia carinata TaxID=120202 RepID=UPI00257D84F4|nr:trypsin-7-like [Daphnia carinata]